MHVDGSGAAAAGAAAGLVLEPPAKRARGETTADSSNEGERSDQVRPR
jgi:hypothetical protein